MTPNSQAHPLKSQSLKHSISLALRTYLKEGVVYRIAEGAIDSYLGSYTRLSSQEL